MKYTVWIGKNPFDEDEEVIRVDWVSAEELQEISKFFSQHGIRILAEPTEQEPPMIILPEDKPIISPLSAEDAKQVLLALFSTEDDMPELSTAANIVYAMLKARSIRISTTQTKSSS